MTGGWTGFTPILKVKDADTFDASTMNPPLISVPNFGLLVPMIKGTDRITTQLAAMKLGLLKELESTPLPFKTETLNLFLIWHRREHDDLTTFPLTS